MSLTTLKRKTDGSYHVSGGKHGQGYVNKISSGRAAFSLNDSRRVGAHSGDTSIQTRMRGTGYRGHGGCCGKFIINPVRSSYQNDYDPFGKARVGKPKQVPACPVVQETYPRSYDLKYQTQIALSMKKDLCDPTSKASGTCSGTNFPNHLGRKSGKTCNQVATYVKRPKMDYSEYLRRKKTPLPPEQSHYPPRVSRNSIFVSVPNITYANFIQRVTCA
jgi:hypothetical protein